MREGLPGPACLFAGVAQVVGDGRVFGKDRGRFLQVPDGLVEAVFPVIHPAEAVGDEAVTGLEGKGLFDHGLGLVEPDPAVGPAVADKVEGLGAVGFLLQDFLHFADAVVGTPRPVVEHPEPVAQIRALRGDPDAVLERFLGLGEPAVGLVESGQQAVEGRIVFLCGQGFFRPPDRLGRPALPFQNVARADLGAPVERRCVRDALVLRERLGVHLLFLVGPAEEIPRLVVVRGACQQGVEFVDGPLRLLRFQEGQREGEAGFPVAAVEFQDLLEGLDGLRVFLFPDLELCQAQTVSHAQGVLLDQPSIDLPGPGGLVADLVQQRQVGQGGLEARLQRDGLFHPRHGFLVQLHLAVDLAEVVVTPHVPGVFREQRSERADRLVVALLLCVDHAQVEIGVVALRGQCDDPPVGPDGLFVILLEEVDASQEREGLGVVGVVDQGLLTDVGGAVQVPHLHVQPGELRGEESRLRVQLEGLFVFPCRLLQLAVQGEHRAERIVIGGVRWRGGRAGFLRRRGRGEPAERRQCGGQQDCGSKEILHGVWFLFGLSSGGFCLAATRSDNRTRRIPAAGNRGIASSRALIVSG